MAERFCHQYFAMFHFLSLAPVRPGSGLSRAHHHATRSLAQASLRKIVRSIGMYTFHRLLGLFLLVLTMSVACTGAEKWIHAQTAHFELYSCASEHDSRHLLNDLEQFRAAFRTMLSLPMTGDKPVTVILFDSRDQFEPYEPLYKGQVKQVGGFCAYLRLAPSLRYNRIIGVTREKPSITSMFTLLWQMLG